MADSNQLLQVCVQVLGNALHAVDQYGHRTLTVAAKQEKDVAIISIFDTWMAANLNTALNHSVKSGSSGSHSDPASVGHGVECVPGHPESASWKDFLAEQYGSRNHDPPRTAHHFCGP